MGRAHGLVLLLAALGCGSAPGPTVDAGVDAQPPCNDVDGDGFGEGAGCLGPDCREDDPTTQQCVCDANGVGTGCSCAADAEPLPCFEADAEKAGVGVCLPGLRRCVDGRWSACDGQVLPRDEVCDGEDDDCDGVVDDGVLSPCGDCNSNCNVAIFGQGGEPFASDDPNVADAGDGAVTLALGATEGVVSVHVEADQSCINWSIRALDAEIPAGATVSIESLRAWDQTWELVLELPAGELPAAVPHREQELDLRLTLRAAKDGSAPVVRSLRIFYNHSYCG